MNLAGYLIILDQLSQLVSLYLNDTVMIITTLPQKCLSTSGWATALIALQQVNMLEYYLERWGQREC